MQTLTEDVQQMMAKIADWCRSQPVKLGVLFGSQATGRQRPDSDVDLAIWRIPVKGGQVSMEIIYTFFIQNILKTYKTLVLPL